jgi:cation:H+ antiporter
MVLNHFLISVFFLIVSLLFVFWAADLIIVGVSSYARKLGLSDYITGLLVVALAASTPEVISSLTGLLSGNNSIMFGTILGTNMVHVAFFTGLLAIIGKKVDVESTILSEILVPLWLVLMVPFVLMAWDGYLGRVDGFILVALFCIYLVWLWRKEKKFGHMKKNVLMRRLYRDAFIFLGSLVVLFIASQTLVFSSVVVAAIIGIPSYFIALTVISVGGALPDFAVSLKSMRSGHQDIGMGDILGSIIIEFLLFFGLVGIFHPMPVDLGEIANAIIFLVIGLTTLLWIIRGKTMTWKHGVFMLGCYLVFIAIEIFKMFRA